MKKYVEYQDPLLKALLLKGSTLKMGRVAKQEN